MPAVTRPPLHPYAILAIAVVLPGFGHQDSNDWGLGFELKDSKGPHWTGHTNAATTFGHAASRVSRPCPTSPTTPWILR